MFDSYESRENEARIIDKLIGYNVDAIILSVVSAERVYRPAYMKQLELLNIPVILVDRELDANRPGTAGYRGGTGERSDLQNYFPLRQYVSAHHPSAELRQTECGTAAVRNLQVQRQCRSL